MRELDRIRHALAAALARGEPAVLVTVLGVEGSVYRGAGARMVVTGSETVGAVSGGCLDADIVARAPDVLARGRAEVARYDTRASDDVVLGLGLGCQGVIDVLLEPLAGDALREAVAFYERIASSPVALTLATVVEGADIGTRTVLEEGDDAQFTDESRVVREVVKPATRLIICGGGTDAIPLARLAHSMGWRVTVVDHRPAFLTAARFPGATLCADVAQVEVGPATRAVVMAHSAQHDRTYLHAMLEANVEYVGVLGPRRRTLELLGGRAMPPSVHAPVGLDLGAESPEEIALAIVAEITAVNAGREGGPLRERRGPIHDRETSPRAHS